MAVKEYCANMPGPPSIVKRNSDRFLAAFMELMELTDAARAEALRTRWVSCVQKVRKWKEKKKRNAALDAAAAAAVTAA